VDVLFAFINAMRRHYRQHKKKLLLTSVATFLITMRKLFYAAFCLVLTAFAVSCQSDDDRMSLPEEPADALSEACMGTFIKLQSQT